MFLEVLKKIKPYNHNEQDIKKTTKRKKVLIK